MSTVRYIDVDPALQQAVLDLPANAGVTVEVATVDVFGNVSAYQTAVAHTTAKDTTAPAVPSGLAAYGQPLGALVAWTANTEPDFDHYDLEYSTDSTFVAGVTHVYGKANVVSITNLAAADFPAAGTAYYFRVQALDHTGNASFAAGSVSAIARLHGCCPFAFGEDGATLRLRSCQGCGSTGRSVSVAVMTERYRVAGTREPGSAATTEDAGGGAAVHAALPNASATTAPRRNVGASHRCPSMIFIPRT